MEKVIDILHSGIFSDINIVVKGETFKAHRNILATFSEYFKDLLTIYNNDDVIYLNQTDPEIFKNVLEIIYGKHVITNKELELEIIEMCLFLIVDVNIYNFIDDIYFTDPNKLPLYLKIIRRLPNYQVGEKCRIIILEILNNINDHSYYTDGLLDDLLYILNMSDVIEYHYLKNLPAVFNYEFLTENFDSIYPLCRLFILILYSKRNFNDLPLHIVHINFIYDVIEKMVECGFSENLFDLINYDICNIKNRQNKNKNICLLPYLNKYQYIIQDCLLFHNMYNDDGKTINSVYNVNVIDSDMKSKIINVVISNDVKTYLCYNSVITIKKIDNIYYELTAGTRYNNLNETSIINEFKITPNEDNKVNEVNEVNEHKLKMLIRYYGTHKTLHFYKNVTLTQL